MAYEYLGRDALDYYPCRYGKSKLLFRGPRRKLDKPYSVAIGGTETYGKFLEEPFPAMLEQLVEQPVVNLGCQNAGYDVYAYDDDIIDICTNAQVTIIQVNGALNNSNRFYSVHPRRNDRFVKASSLLQTSFRGVDYTDFHFTRHLLSKLSESSPEKFEMVRDELKEAWIARLQTLTSRIGGRIVLLWLAGHSPDDEKATQELGNDPAFVDRAMLNRVAGDVTDYVEVVATRSEIEAGKERLIHNALEEIVAQEMLGPIVHEAAAWRLKEILPKNM